MAKKRMYASLLGIPVWVISGLALFIIFSAGYDWVVQDRSSLRLLLAAISGGVILLMALVLHLMPLGSVKKQAGNQLGK